MNLHPKVATVDPTKFCKALRELGKLGLSFGIVFFQARQHSDPRICPDCCACAMSGHAALALPSKVMNPRRLMERPLGLGAYHIV
jgi:hypothetical protein